MTERSRVGRRSAWPWLRVTGVIGAGAAMVAGASHATAPVDLGPASAGPPASSASATPGAGASLVDAVDAVSTLGCAGPEQQGAADRSVPEQPQTVTVRALSAPSAALPDGFVPAEAGAIALSSLPRGAGAEQPDADQARATERGEAVTLAVSSAVGVLARAEGALAGGLAGAQVHLGTGQQRRGLEVAACTEPSNDSWLMAGGAQPGRVERLVLLNPGANPVTVHVELLGASGRQPRAAGGVVVAPSARTVVVVDALAPREQRPVVHVTSTGGPVVAALGERWLDGSLDRGLELSTPAAAPATELVIPAVPVPSHGEGGTTALRVAVPGTQPAVVQLRALTPGGPVDVANDVATAGAGQVIDIDLSDLPTGTSALHLSADTPVVAAARVERRAERTGPSDLAWIPAGEPVDTLTGTPLIHPPGRELSHELTLATIDGSVVDVVTATGSAVQTRRVVVRAAGVQTLTLGAAESVWVRPVSGQVWSAVVSTTTDELGTLIAAMTLPELTLRREVVAVQPWRP